MSDTIVIAAILDTRELQLYRKDGTTLSIPQGDPRLQRVVDIVLPALNSGAKEVAVPNEILTGFVNSYADFEKKTNSLVRFFRVAKEKVKHLFSTEEERAEQAPHLAPFSAGQVPGQQMAQPAVQPTVTQQVQQVQQEVASKPKPVENNPIPQMGAGLVSGVMQGGTPVTSAEFASRELDKDETIVAVVGDSVIPGMEKLQSQFNHVFRGNNPEGVQNLIKRLGAMIQKRGHSVEDVLRFLEKSDLSVAYNGDIIGYKLLMSTTRYPSEVVRSGPGIFYDVHSQRVPQRVGSVVCVDESLVDKNRRNECSNGLHVARRAYLAGFSGDVIVMIRMAPEDIITVPHGDANKVRVCRYHIVAQVEKSDYDKLKSNRAMTEGSTETQKMLAKVLAGDHIDRMEEVRITGQSGQGVQIKPLVPGQDISGLLPIEKVKDAPKLAEALPDADKPQQAAPVDPKAVAQAAEKPKAEPKKEEPAPVTPSSTPAQPKGGQRQVIAKRLYETMMGKAFPDATRRQAALDLQAHKKKAKIGWSALSLPESTPKDIEEILLLTEGKETKPTLAPATNQATEMEKAQRAAVAEVKAGGQSKSAIARKYGTSTRSLDRWVEKFGK